MKIVEHPSEALKLPCEELSRQVCRSAWLKRLGREMSEFVFTRKGYGLAAPQIGKNLRFCVVNHGEGFKVYCNPEIVEWSPEESTEAEWCYSIPGKGFNVTRFNEVVVKYRNLAGKTETIKAGGMLARILQHEIDHLNSLCIADTGEEISGG